ncbi:MAG: hypothetical protein RLZZ297_608 [Chloroflexota bacterium]
MRIVVRTGVDLLHLGRFATVVDRHGARFTTRYFSPREIAEAGNRVRSYATRWAAKEATAKMLGVGLRGLGSGAAAVSWLSIEVVHDELRKPLVVLHNDARSRAAALGLQSLDVSVSHDGNYVVVSVVGAGLVNESLEG